MEQDREAVMGSSDLLPKFQRDAQLLAKEINDKCLQCGLCQRDCAFLGGFPSPKELALDFLEKNDFDTSVAFECSLCGLCRVLCPKGLRIDAWMLELRRIAHHLYGIRFSEHNTIRRYERLGTSPIFSYYAMPKGSDTVFFPGCTLQGTRPEQLKHTFMRLNQLIPSLGIVLDCCSKPSHDLGDHGRFLMYFHELKGFLLDSGIRQVITACPNCFKVFNKYGEGLETITVYEVLRYAVQGGKCRACKGKGPFTIHDPCVMRDQDGVHHAVRALLNGLGIETMEMRHSRRKTVCCGEGGSVGFLNPEFPKNWNKIREKDAENRTIVTYCAGCSASLTKKGLENHHILDILYEEDTGRSPKVYKPPMTYLNRLFLKRFFKRNMAPSITRTRPRLDKTSNKPFLKRIIPLVLLLATILVVHFSGLSGQLTVENLQRLVKDVGVYAPLIYVAIYSVAPALFLPGLPMTIAGGIIFGPVFGVIYSIIGATIGATVAFLVARYIGGDWIEKKIKGPKFRELHERVVRHGWKAVAFTRLIPLFPFNLLNYAFGLTPIPLSHYVVTSFICMLPACIAYVVFSSSLLDVISGQVSWKFVVGLSLVILVSSIPFFLKKRMGKETADNL